MDKELKQPSLRVHLARTRTTVHGWAGLFTNTSMCGVSRIAFLHRTRARNRVAIFVLQAIEEDLSCDGPPPRSKNINELGDTFRSLASVCVSTICSK